MKKHLSLCLIVALCCALYLGFWFFRAYHMKGLIAELIREKSGVEYTEIGYRGFPLSVIVDLKNPKLSSVFDLKGNLAIGTSLLARKGWVEISGDARISVLDRRIGLSGKVGCIHHDLWKLIRNRKEISRLSSRIFANEGIFTLAPRVTFYGDELELKLEENILSADHVSLYTEFNRKNRSIARSLRFDLDGGTFCPELLQKYYFRDKIDLRVDLAANGTSETGLPNSIEVKKFIIADPYFRNKFDGALQLKEEGGTIEADLVFNASQEVKRPYSPEVQKEHFARIFGNQSMNLPERKLFGKIECKGVAHCKLYPSSAWEIVLRESKWKFGNYKVNLAGMANGPELKGSLDLEFLNYPSLKSYIEKKHSNSLLEPLAFLETLSSPENDKNALRLQVQYDGLCKIGDLPLGEVLQKAKAL